MVSTAITQVYNTKRERHRDCYPLLFLSSLFRLSTFFRQAHTVLLLFSSPSSAHLSPGSIVTRKRWRRDAYYYIASSRSSHVRQKLFFTSIEKFITRFCVALYASWWTPECPLPPLSLAPFVLFCSSRVRGESDKRFWVATLEVSWCRKMKSVLVGRLVLSRVVRRYDYDYYAPLDIPRL